MRTAVSSSFHVESLGSRALPSVVLPPPDVGIIHPHYVDAASPAPHHATNFLSGLQAPDGSLYADKSSEGQSEVRERMKAADEALEALGEELAETAEHNAEAAWKKLETCEEVGDNFQTHESSGDEFAEAVEHELAEGEIESCDPEKALLEEAISSAAQERGIGKLHIDYGDFETMREESSSRDGQESVQLSGNVTLAETSDAKGIRHRPLSIDLSLPEANFSDEGDSNRTYRLEGSLESEGSAMTVAILSLASTIPAGVEPTPVVRKANILSPSTLRGKRNFFQKPH